MITKFRHFLMQQNLSENTVNSYVFTVEHFFVNYEEITKKNLLAYKGMLVEKYKAKTVNLRIQGINKYLEFLKKDKDKLKFVKEKRLIEKSISRFLFYSITSALALRSANSFSTCAFCSGVYLIKSNGII